MGCRSGPGSTRTADKSAAVVVEITPCIFNTTEDSATSVMTWLKHDRTHVRVAGWPMFDPMHPEQVGNTRATRWEVHPVVDIQEKISGKWNSVFE